MNAICLITFRPNDIWCNFLFKFKFYDIYVVIDDNNFNYNELKISFPNINFIKMTDDECKKNGYIDSSFTLRKLISGWDKGLCYFGINNDKYDFVWFMEDDVFFNGENTLINIDNQYLDTDLLSNIYEINTNGNKNIWHWNVININYNPPFYNAMICVVRFSKNMIKCINNYVLENKTLCFIEALFPTVAIKNNLKYKNPEQFKNIYFQHCFNANDIDLNNLYHPVKNINDHIIFRNKFGLIDSVDLLNQPIQSTQSTQLTQSIQTNPKQNKKKLNFNKIILNKIEQHKNIML